MPKVITHRTACAQSIRSRPPYRRDTQKSHGLPSDGIQSPSADSDGSVPALSPDRESSRTLSLPPTPFSEVSTVVTDAGPDHKAFYDDHFWQFDHIIQVVEDECQVHWSDSALTITDFYSGVLHGKPLEFYAKLVQPDGVGLLRVTWEPTWEPLTDWSKSLSDISYDPRFCSPHVAGQVDGIASMCYPPCIIHSSLLELASLEGSKLSEHVWFRFPFVGNSDGDGDVDGLLYVIWKPYY